MAWRAMKIEFKNEDNVAIGAAVFVMGLEDTATMLAAVSEVEARWKAEVAAKTGAPSPAPWDGAIDGGAGSPLPQPQEGQ